MKKYLNTKFPFFLHGADYNPDQWKDTKEIWDEDMRLMKLANCNEMTVGIFAWSALEPKEGEFDFSWLDEIVDKIYRSGGTVVLATPSGARPRWLAEKYPEVLRVNENGVRIRFGDRHNHCYTSPIYRQKVQEINERLALRYGKHPAVVAWHISNEYCGECHCPLCVEAFRRFLKEKYDGDIQKLNHAYWTAFWSRTYDSFDQVEPPSSLGAVNLHGLTLDWKRFVTERTVDFMKAELEPIRRICPDIPVTTNMMPGYTGLNYAKFLDACDIISIDVYPDWHEPEWLRPAVKAAFWYDFYRSLKNRSFMLMESAPGLVNWKAINKLKRQGMDVLASMQAVAHGSDTVQYFQFRKSRGASEKWHGAVVDHVGNEHTRIFGEIKKTGEILQKIREVAGSCVKARVAILYDLENQWALDDSEGFQRFQKKYEETLISYYEPLWEKGIAVDVLAPSSDFSGYDFVIAPMQYMTGKKLIEKFEAFVKNGGTLYATYMLGMVDETDLCHLGGFPAKTLKEVFGIWNEEIDSLYPEERVTVQTDDGGRYEAKDYCELIHARAATVLARYQTEFYAGRPAYTVNVYGKGKAYYQAFRDTGDFKRKAIGEILKELNIEGCVATLPKGVSAHERTDGETRYLFVENYSNEEVCVPLKTTYTDMLTGEKTATAVLSAYGVGIFKN